MKNIQYRIVLRDGDTVDVNISNAKDICDAAPEIKESILAGDVKRNGIPIKMEDVFGIEDIPG